MDEDMLARMNDNQNRDRILEDLNRSTLDDVGPVGKTQAAKMLQEMNNLSSEESRLLGN